MHSPGSRGSVLSLGVVGTWLPNLTSGQGWIALAVVIFASWRPLPLIAGALLFGGLGTFGNVAQVEGWSISTEFFSALPYVGTLTDGLRARAASDPARRRGSLAGGARPAVLPGDRLGVMGRFTGKVALITGAARGQGAAEAELFCREGARVMLADVLDEDGERQAEALRDAGCEARYRHLDVTSPSDWHAAVSEAEAEFGSLDVLVNNAGIVRFDGVETSSDQEWADTLAVNQSGVFFGMRAAVPSMRRAGAGAIVNISSIFGVDAVPGYFAYQASKGAVVQMTRAAAVDLAPHGIRVNCVLPGLIFTDMTKTEPEEMIAENIRMTPMGRGGEAEEVASGVLFLASDEASFVTGAVLPIDGGYAAC